MPPVTALVRKPGPCFVQALSNHSERHAIDARRACQQHQLYAEALRKTGAEVISLEPLEGFPDSPFVEDTAVVFDHGALTASMKEESRQGEVASVAREMGRYRKLTSVQLPATLDGGDVLVTEQTVFVGLSSRTNREGIEAVAAFSGKPTIAVQVYKGLHLKSAVSYLGRNLLVVDPASVATAPFKTFEWIEVEENEPYAANCLSLGNFVLMPAGFPGVADKIRAHGFAVLELEMSEFEKADGGVTCLSLIIPKIPG